MTAATLVNLLEASGLMGMEVVTLTVTDGYTYTAKKISKIEAVIATANDTAVTAAIDASWSGAVVTFGSTGLAAKKVSLVIFGKP